MKFKLYNSMFNSNWNIAGLFTNDYVNLNLYKLCKQYDITLPIKSVFGSINTPLHGGRGLGFYIFPNNSELKKIIDEYNSLEIGVNLVFSNYHITKHDLSDAISNELLEYCNRSNINGVILSSDILYDYVKSKYPNLKVICSLLKTVYETKLGKTDTVEYYNSLIPKYDTIVINVARATDITYLQQLSDLSKIEIICNHICVKNCPIAKEDYDGAVEFNTIRRKYGTPLPEQFLDVQIILNKREQINRKCAEMHLKNPNNNTMLSMDQVETLQNIGIHQFKLEGRLEHPGKWIYDLTRWFFKMNDDNIHNLIHCVNYKSIVDGAY